MPPDSKTYSTLNYDAPSRDLPLSLVLETTGPDPVTDSVTVIACDNGSESFVFPTQDAADKSRLAEFLQSRPLILYDAAACGTFLKRLGIHPKTVHDPKLMLFALDPNQALDLVSTASRHAGITIPAQTHEPIENGIFQIQESTFFSQPNESLLLAAKAIRLMHEHLHEKLGWAEKIYTQERTLIPTCIAMQLRGIEISPTLLDEKIKALETDVAALNLLLSKLATDSLPPSFTPAIGEINWMSSRDSAQVLMALGIPLDRKTRSGKISMSDAVLERLKNAHPLVPLLSELHHKMKILGSAKTIKKFYNPTTKAIHSEWIQSGVPTGRFRSRNPNLQQITDELRQVFVARPGHYFINLDYDQLEYRILAACAGETVLVDAFRQGEDVHTKTAALMLGSTLKAISKEQRDLGKMLGYAQLYGSGAYGLASKLNIPREKADTLLKQYFAAVPKLVGFLSRLRQTAQQKGYVESYYGRRRLLPQLYSKDRKTRAFGQRSAVNGFAQSTAADIAKDAMIRLAPVLQSLNVHMLIQLHDGLLIEVPDAITPQDALSMLKPTMETSICGLPLTVSASWGHNWKELTELS